MSKLAITLTPDSYLESGKMDALEWVGKKIYNWVSEDNSIARRGVLVYKDEET